MEAREVQVPVRNRPNIVREARRTSFRASITFWGSATGGCY